MKYDFDIITKRMNTNSLKWGNKEDELPMWVADMDFLVAPEIKEAIGKRLEHGIYGYSTVPDELFESYVNWWDRRHNFKMKKDELLFCIGVMPAISSMIREFTKEGDNIIIQTPVYHIFFKVIEDNNRNVLENKLLFDGENYEMDFESLEKQLSSDKTKMMLLCNPHNPIGRIWTKKEIEKIIGLCKKYNVLLISDEIHCDLVDPDKKYYAAGRLSSDVVTCLAPTKTFNIAGIQSSVIHIPNKKLYKQMQKRLIMDDSSQINVFSIDATIAAFNNAEEWLNQLNEYIYHNKKTVENFLDDEIPEIRLIACEATYLLWLDCEKLNINSKDLSSFIREKTGLFLSPGRQFGENGDNFLRMNIACPQEILIDGLERLKKSVELLKEST